MTALRPANGSPRILVVDSQQDMLIELQRLLKGAGFTQVSTATNIPDAVKMLSQRSFTVVLSDDSPAGRTALELVRAARAAGGGWSTRRDVPIIMITGHSERDYVLTAKEAGVSAFLVKPVNAARLKEKVAAVLARAQSPVAP